MTPELPVCESCGCDHAFRAYYNGELYSVRILSWCMTHDCVNIKMVNRAKARDGAA